MKKSQLIPILLFTCSLLSAQEPAESNNRKSDSILPRYMAKEQLGMSLEWLYWKANIANYSWMYAYNNEVTPFTHTFYDFGTKWDSGVRAGVYYNATPRMGFDVHYTHFYSVAQESFFNPATLLGLDEGFEPANGVVNNEDIVTAAIFNATGTFKIQLDEIDWLLRKTFAIQPQIHLTPFVGAKASILRLTTNQFYQEANTQTIGIDTSNRWWGAGLVAGFKSEWYLTSSFALFLSGDAALEGGYSQANSTLLVTAPAINQTKTFNQTRFFPILDGAAGLVWKTSFSRDRYQFALKAAYEGHFYADAFPVVVFNDVTDDNSLTFQGLSLGGYFFF